MRDPAFRPEEFSSFVGRSSEVAELRGLMRVMRAVTLCGVGGIGKTRLASRLLAAVESEYPDGAWFVELGDLRDPARLTDWLAACIGVREEPGQPMSVTLAEALRHRRAIIVLDNCEHLVEDCARLCQQLLARSPGLQVIATSREPLRMAAEAVWQVPPLSVPGADDSTSTTGTSTSTATATSTSTSTSTSQPSEAGDHGTLAAHQRNQPATDTGLATLARYDAVRLFAERAAAATPGFALTEANAPVVARICRALDGLPLAVELAAAWVRVLSVEQVAARLDRRLALLTSTDRSVPARQQTLRAAFDWSYELLGDRERILLARLSVFAGWSLDMAEQVCADASLPAGEIVDVLTTLVDKSLVEVEPDALGQARYRMLETVREYASALLELAGEAPLLRQRRRAYTLREVESSADIGMAIVAAPWSARVEVFRRFDLEAGNLGEVLSECLADGDAEAGLRVCTAMRPVWIVRGSFAEGTRWIEQLLGLDATVPDAVRGRALASLAQLVMATNPHRAEQLATSALELSWAAGESFWVGAALNLLTEIALHAGRLDEATDRAGEALQVATAAADRWNEGYALGTMAAVIAARGNLREAQGLAERALAIMREIEQLWGSARTLLGLGDLARLRAELSVARDHYLEALAILREVNARPEIARSLAGLGRVAIEQWDLPSARQHLTESLRLSYASGSRIGMARGLEVLARLASLEGDPAMCLRLAGAVTTLRADAHLPPMPGARQQRFLDAASDLGEPAIARLWADGAAMTPDAAVRLALGDLAQGGGTPGRRTPGDALAGREPADHTLAGHRAGDGSRSSRAGRRAHSP